MQAFKEKGVMFLAGFGVACMLALSVGAAQRQAPHPNRYDANVIFGGVGLQVVDHRTNTFYVYGFGTEKGSYMLSRKVDLNHTGQLELKFEGPQRDDDKDE